MENLNINDVAYAFTVIGGGWGYNHELFVIMTDNTVYETTKFDDKDILYCEPEYKFNLYSLAKEQSEVWIGTRWSKDEHGNEVKKVDYLDSLTNDDNKVDFEDIRDGSECIMDAPVYTVYKNVNNELVGLVRTYNFCRIHAVAYTEAVYSHMRELEHIKNRK